MCHVFVFVRVYLLSRSDFASFGSATEAKMGADVEVDCREGTNEHAVYVPSRPGSTSTHACHHNYSSSVSGNMLNFLTFYNARRDVHASHVQTGTNVTQTLQLHMMHLLPLATHLA